MLRLRGECFVAERDKVSDLRVQSRRILSSNGPFDGVTLRDGISDEFPGVGMI